MSRKGTERLIVALDVPTAARARELVETLATSGCAFKLGLELLYAEGPSLVRDLARAGRLFVDVKLHDIPNTVAGAARALAQRGAWLLTVHVAGGRAMCEAALAAAAEGAAQAGDQSYGRTRQYRHHQCNLLRQLQVNKDPSYLRIP